jgi:hypothetical protein
LKPKALRSGKIRFRFRIVKVSGTLPFSFEHWQNSRFVFAKFSMI